MRFVFYKVARQCDGRLGDAFERVDVAACRYGRSHVVGLRETEPFVGEVPFLQPRARDFPPMSKQAIHTNENEREQKKPYASAGELE